MLIVLYVYISYSLNSLRGVLQGMIWGTTIGERKGDTRSLDYSSYVYMYVNSGKRSPYSPRNHSNSEPLGGAGFPPSTVCPG